MRRHQYFAALLASAMVLGSVGCAKSETAETTTSATTTTEVTAATEAPTTEAATTEAGKTYSDEMRDISAMEFVKDMHIGWNYGNAMDATNDNASITDEPNKFETAWGAQFMTPMEMQTLREGGFDVIRIPVTWTGHIHDDEKHTIEASWMDRVQEVVDMAYQSGAYVILNAHHETWYDPYYDNVEAGSQMMKDIWSQIGERFADYGDHLIFEGMNEPRQRGTSIEWTGNDEARDVINTFSKVFVETIRSLGGKNEKRFLMVPGYAASAGNANLEAIVLPEDDHLIVSVHAYIPYYFALDGGKKNDWSEDNASDRHDIEELMREIKKLFVDKDIPVIIGEFGAQNKENDEARQAWVSFFIKEARKQNVTCVWWDNHCYSGDGEKFGLLQCNGFNFTWYYPNVLKAMMDAAYAK